MYTRFVYTDACIPAYEYTNACIHIYIHSYIYVHVAADADDDDDNENTSGDDDANSDDDDDDIFPSSPSFSPSSPSSSPRAGTVQVRCRYGAGQVCSRRRQTRAPFFPTAGASFFDSGSIGLCSWQVRSCLCSNAQKKCSALGTSDGNSTGNDGQRPL